jgi:hypothetical protein
MIGFLAVGTLALATTSATDTTSWTRLQGAFVGTGTAMGAASTARASWQPVLGGRFVRLEMEFGPSGGAPIFSGHAYYDVRGESGHWLDVQGSQYALKHRFVGDTLVVVFEMRDGIRGESRYWPVGEQTVHERTEVIFADGRRQPLLEFAFTRRGGS